MEQSFPLIRHPNPKGLDRMNVEVTESLEIWIFPTNHNDETSTNNIRKLTVHDARTLAKMLNEAADLAEKSLLFN